MKQVKQTAAQTFQVLDSLKRQHAINPTPNLQITISALEQRANSLMDTEMALKLKSFEAKHVGADWYQIMEKNYPITFDDERQAWVVTSNARDWEETRDWEFSYKYDALEKVRKLVNWIHVARTRGFGDREADLERFHNRA